MEDKYQIVRELERTLSLTRGYGDLRLTYDVNKCLDGNGKERIISEYVSIYYGTNTKPSQRVNVTWNSGIAIIRDVVKALY